MVLQFHSQLLRSVNPPKFLFQTVTTLWIIYLFYTTCIPYRIIPILRIFYEFIQIYFRCSLGFLYHPLLSNFLYLISYMSLFSVPVTLSYILLTWREIMQQCSCTPQYVAVSGSLLHVGQIFNSLFLPVPSVSKFQFSATLFLSWIPVYMSIPVYLSLAELLYTRTQCIVTKLNTSLSHFWLLKGFR
jgi:hypothetical protein